jgi:hypothetical protein
MEKEKHEKQNRRNSCFDAGGHYGGVCDKYQYEGNDPNDIVWG